MVSFFYLYWWEPLVISGAGFYGLSVVVAQPSALQHWMKLRALTPTLSFLHLLLDSWNRGVAPFTSHLHHHYLYDTTTVLRSFFWNHPGEPVPEENFWTLWCKGRLTEADTPTIRLCATSSGLTSAHLHHPPITCMIVWSYSGTGILHARIATCPSVLPSLLWHC